LTLPLGYVEGAQNGKTRDHSTHQHATLGPHRPDLNGMPRSSIHGTDGDCRTGISDHWLGDTGQRSRYGDVRLAAVRASSFAGVAGGA